MSSLQSASLARVKPSATLAVTAQARELKRQGRDVIEQRKAAWLARAYAAEVECKSGSATARASLDTVLTEMQLVLPEGGAIPREIAAIRSKCGKR